MTTGKPVGETTPSRLPDIGCLGSDKAERSPQPRLVAVPIVPDNVKEHVTTEYPANGSSDLARVVRNDVSAVSIDIQERALSPFARYRENGQAARLISTS